MDATFWLMFIVVSIMFAWILALLIKFILGKYFVFFVPIPTFFIMLFILVAMIALQALGVKVSSLYAWFFSSIARLLQQGGLGW